MERFHMQGGLGGATFGSRADGTGAARGATVPHAIPARLDVQISMTGGNIIGSIAGACEILCLARSVFCAVRGEPTEEAQHFHSARVALSGNRKSMIEKHGRYSTESNSIFFKRADETFGGSFFELIIFKMILSNSDLWVHASKYGN
ncbi:hypothetical protein ACFMPD_11995 [Sedimentitalea sp. HM32M-2]|uniref:hypothetical protein n=1 Tax=Sedimentitalea sp. HM32M-2 TaxID=3351566 RepID=UPI00363AEA23